MSKPTVVYKLTPEQQAMAEGEIEYARGLARKYIGRTYRQLDRDDADSAAGLATVYAAYHYDRSKGVPLRTFVALKLRSILKDDCRYKLRRKSVWIHQDSDEQLESKSGREVEPWVSSQAHDLIEFLGSKVKDKSRRILHKLAEGRSVADVCRELGIHKSTVSLTKGALRNLLHKLSHES